MPEEDRRIIFSYEEAYKAIYALCMQKEIKRPPPGVISSVILDPEDNKRFKIKISNPQNNENHEMDYSSDFIAAALMLFCRTINIPIPKRARKAVKLRENGIILHLTM